ncbi:conserved hypothetical protein [Mesobacillus persicus]|uniref:EthD domain-containing protein n=1 Tax=Mesobacillus persicus TaxID=930146 RepID=A0A1H8G220_9BACI|nr:EthD family reductase [Mesobacillus persicus]SEN37805.1 conserved hypothetical protein [Mesobacillus persicus]
MAKFIVMYEEPKDKDGFEKYYNEVHIPMVEKIPNVQGANVHHVLKTLNKEEPLYLIAELVFESPEVLMQSLATPEFQAVQADVKNIMEYLNKPPVVALVD